MLSAFITTISSSSLSLSPSSLLHPVRQARVPGLVLRPTVCLSTLPECHTRSPCSLRPYHSGLLAHPTFRQTLPQGPACPFLLCWRHCLPDSQGPVSLPPSALGQRTIARPPWPLSLQKRLPPPLITFFPIFHPDVFVLFDLCLALLN